MSKRFELLVGIIKYKYTSNMVLNNNIIKTIFDIQYYVFCSENFLNLNFKHKSQ